MPGLLFQPLMRHGNHAVRQVPVKGQLVVQQDVELGSPAELIEKWS